MAALSLPDEKSLRADAQADRQLHNCHDCGDWTDDHRLSWFYPGGYQAIRWLCHGCYDARRQMTVVRGE